MRFDDKSEPIVLDKGRDAKFVSLAITRDSMGRVLNYKTKVSSFIVLYFAYLAITGDSMRRVLDYKTKVSAFIVLNFGF